MRTIVGPFVVLCLFVYSSCSYVDLEDDFKEEISYQLIGDWTLGSFDYEQNLTIIEVSQVILDHEKIHVEEMDYSISIDTSVIVAEGMLKVSFLHTENGNTKADLTKSFSGLDCDASMITFESTIHLEGSLFDFQFSSFKAASRFGDKSYHYEIKDNGELMITLDKVIDEADVTGTETFTSMWVRK